MKKVNNKSMNIKILFVYPDFENLGVEYLMAILKKKWLSC